MAAPRLSDAQKQEVVDRFRAGAGTQELAAEYGCSPNTVIRVVKAALEPSLYEELKRQRGRRAGQAAETGTPASAAEAPQTTDPEAHPPASRMPGPDCEPARVAIATPTPPDAMVAAEAGGEGKPETETDGDGHEAARFLAIDDADDFGAFEDEDDDDEDYDAELPEQTFVEVPISLAGNLDQPLTTPRPWSSEELPTSAYMLVDKTVELQTLSLAEIPELGRLEAEELELQALVLYSNPRQAKRHCGRTQRVIKIPDVGVLERQAVYLLRQGIRRVVVEGALYALPET